MFGLLALVLANDPPAQPRSCVEPLSATYKPDNGQPNVKPLPYAVPSSPPQPQEPQSYKPPKEAIPSYEGPSNGHASYEPPSNTPQLEEPPSYALISGAVLVSPNATSVPDFRLTLTQATSANYSPPCITTLAYTETRAVTWTETITVTQPSSVSPAYMHCAGEGRNNKWCRLCLRNARIVSLACRKKRGKLRRRRRRRKRRRQRQSTNYFDTDRARTIRYVACTGGPWST